MADYEVEWIEVAGQRLLASDAVCPVCKVLDLDMVFEMATADHPWLATCSKGHEWQIEPL